MTYLSKRFKEVLNADYMHLVQETASFAYEIEEYYPLKTLRIYFECSNGLTDWKNNFDFPAKPYRDMQDKWYAHRGFLRVWKAIEPHLRDLIMDAHLPMIMKQAYHRIDVINSSVALVDKLFVNTAANLNYGGYGEAGEFKPSSKETPVIYLSGKSKKFTAKL